MFFHESDQFVNLLHRNACRLFDKNVFAGANRCGGDFGKRGVDRRYNHCVHFWGSHGFVEITDSAAGFGEFHQFSARAKLVSQATAKFLSRRKTGEPFFPINPQPMMA